MFGRKLSGVGFTNTPYGLITIFFFFSDEKPSSSSVPGFEIYTFCVYPFKSLMYFE
jgi:hypothetical protein